MKLAAEIITCFYFVAAILNIMIVPFIIGHKRKDWGPEDVMSNMISASLFLIILFYFFL